MPKPNSTLIVVVLDRSGSMNGIRHDTLGGFNSFLADQKKNPTDEARLTLVQFDHEYLVSYDNKPLADVPNLTPETYVPRGNTALLDAMGRAIVTTGEALKVMPEAERPEQVVFLCITDGQENASREYTKAKIAEMVKHQTDVYQWNFVFLGANMDAIGEGASMGVAAVNAMNFQASAQGMGVMYQAVSSNVDSYRTSRNAASLSFTSAQRDANANPDDVDLKVLTESKVQAAVNKNDSDSRPKN